MPTTRERILLQRILQSTARKHAVTPSRMIKVHIRKSGRRAKLPAERQEAMRARRARKAAVNAALTEAHETLWEFAKGMANRFPQHDTAYWFRCIMQRPTKQLNERRPNLWNAYLHGEVTRRNKGMHPLNAQSVWAH